jgi:hypothetical protein
MVLDPVLEALSGHELIMHGAIMTCACRKHHEFVPSANFDTMWQRGCSDFASSVSATWSKLIWALNSRRDPKRPIGRLRPLTERNGTYARNGHALLKELADG